MRDGQRSRVYNAEAYIDSKGMVLGDVDTCTCFAEAVWADPTFQERFPIASKTKPPSISASRSEWGGMYYWPPKEKITISKNSMTDLVLLHELAHSITEREYETTDENRINHNWQWCDIYLFLIEKFAGKPLAIDLQEAFLVEKVRFTYRINNSCGIIMDKSSPTQVTGTGWCTKSSTS